MAQRPKHGRRRRGLTAVEVVVLVVILLIVVGVVLTAIPRMRERANRVRCEYNLEQVGKGMHRFQDAKHFLPASRIADGYATWAVQIAPYTKTGQTDQLTKWDLRKPYGAQPEEV